MLLPFDDVLGRVAGTAFATAVAAGLILPLTLMLDRRAFRPAGLFAICDVLAAFFLILGLIWLDLVMDWRYEEALALSIVTLLFSLGLPVFLCLMLLAANRGTVAAITGVAMFGSSSLCMLIAVWGDALGGWSWHLQDNWFETAWVIMPYTVLIVTALIGFGRDDRRFYRWLGNATSVVSIAGILYAIWIKSSGRIGVLSLLTGISILVSYANLAWLMKLKDNQRWLRWSSFAAGIGTTALVVTLAFCEDRNGDPPELVGRAAAAGGIITGCGTLALCVLLAFNRRGESNRAAARVLTLRGECPRCHSEQDFPLGKGRCRVCGLRISIEFDNPECLGCGYLLYKSNASHCPECGRDVTAPSEPEAGLDADQSATS